MEDLERSLEEVIRRIRFRDTIAALAVSSAFIIFAVLLLILLDVILVPLTLKTPISIALLLVTWILMSLGLYLLTTMPIPKLPSRIVADSEGVARLVEKGYAGKIFVTRETFKKLPPKLGLRTNLQVVEVDSREAERYAKYGEELSYAIAGAKKIGAKVVSTRREKVDGVEVLTADEIE